MGLLFIISMVVPVTPLKGKTLSILETKALCFALKFLPLILDSFKSIKFRVFVMWILKLFCSVTFLCSTTKIVYSYSQIKDISL